MSKVMIQRVSSVALWAMTFLLAPQARAQPAFEEITPTTPEYFVNPEEEDFWLSALAPADVDGDGDLDLAMLGFYVVYNKSAEDRLLVLRNDGIGSDGRWTLTPQPAPLGDLVAGRSDLTWGDVDGDGDPDLAAGSEGTLALYRNDTGQLALTATVLPAYVEDSDGTIGYDLRSLAFADSDNDGYLDLLVPSVFDFENFELLPTQLLRNDGANADGGFDFTDTGAALDPTVSAQTAWSDDDNDGDVDLLMTHIDTNGKTGFVRRYRNDGDAGFVGADLLPIRVHHGVTDWADIEGDGDLDVLVAGNIEEADGTFGEALRIYRNDAGNFVPIELALPSPEWSSLLAATWADYDSDGDVDLLVTGQLFGDGKSYGLSEIYGNDGTGAFTALGVQLPAPVTNIGRGGAFSWLDLDSDGDLDYLVSGAYYRPNGNGLVESRTQVFRNVTAATNAAPSAPSQLAAIASGSGVSLSWLAAGDDHTAPAALTYDVEIALVGGAPASGTKRAPEPGAIGDATAWRFENLPPGTYQWSVRAVDAAFAEGARSTGQFVIAARRAIFSATASSEVSACSAREQQRDTREHHGGGDVVERRYALAREQHAE